MTTASPRQPAPTPPSRSARPPRPSPLGDGRRPRLTYAYDEFGRPAAARPLPAQPRHGVRRVRSPHRHDGVGPFHRLHVRRGGRELTRQVGEMLTLEHTFDAVGRLTTQSVVGATGTSLQHRAYTYRAYGNVTAIDDQLSGHPPLRPGRGGPRTAVHAVNWTETYAYDEAGNQPRLPGRNPPRPGSNRRPAPTQAPASPAAGNVRYEHDARAASPPPEKPHLPVSRTLGATNGTPRTA